MTIPLEFELERFLKDLWYLFTTSMEPFFIYTLHPSPEDSQPLLGHICYRQLSSLKEVFYVNQQELKSS